MESLHLKIVLIFTVGFVFASILGYVSNRFRLSPILGYLVAGYLIGPYSPGFVADHEISEQLAEIGVILMMFGVGLHLNWRDLLGVKNIAIPGAIGQTFFSAMVAALLAYAIGWPPEAGIVFGLAIGVASTVVLVRTLSDNGLLNSTPGHISVGWLILEDVITIFVLLMLPALAASLKGEVFSLSNAAFLIGLVLLKFGALVVLMATIGRRLVEFALSKVAKESRELFTLTILALTFAIATGSAILFGTSIALGAFIAGIIIGQTTLRQEVSTNTLALKDAFVVIFFLSIGMLFNPATVANHFLLFVATLTIVLVVKPLVAFLIARLLKYPFKTSLTVALALAQIGEFSFILAEEASKLNILPDAGYDVIVACALVSISLNPVFFKLLKKW